MAEKNEEVRERKLRRLAGDIGLELCVSRTYYVVEQDEAGLDRLCEYNLTLDSAERWLRERADALRAAKDQRYLRERGADNVGAHPPNSPNPQTPRRP